jgi:hypothetical protein
MPTARSSHLQASISKKMTRKTWFLILLCTPIICLAVYYTPSLVSLGWHVMHGMAIQYRGLWVRVPLGWTADLTLTKDDYPANPQGITVEKQQKTLAFEVAGPEMMYFNLLLPDPRTTPAQQAAQWDSLFRQAHPASDFDITSPANLPAGMECLQAIPRASHMDAVLACISLKDGWVADYAGSREHLPVFLRIAALLKIKP